MYLSVLSFKTVVCRWVYSVHRWAYASKMGQQWHFGMKRLSGQRKVPCSGLADRRIQGAWS